MNLYMAHGGTNFGAWAGETSCVSTRSHCSAPSCTDRCIGQSRLAAGQPTWGGQAPPMAEIGRICQVMSSREDLGVLTEGQQCPLAHDLPPTPLPCTPCHEHDWLCMLRKLSAHADRGYR